MGGFSRQQRKNLKYEHFVKLAVGHDFWGMNAPIVLPKCDWVVQVVLSSYSGLFVRVIPGNSASGYAKPGIHWHFP